MKKIFYLIAAGVLAHFIVACDNEPKNPGDFGVKAELSLGDITSTVTGDVYKLSVSRKIDTIFRTAVTRWDTIFDEKGEFVSRTQDTIWVPAKFTTNFYEMEPIVLPEYADTFNLPLKTNAKWLSPTPEIVNVQWLYNEATTGGGGDGHITFRIARNRNYKRTTYTDMYVFTSDSTVMYKIPFTQKGEKDEQ